MKNKKSSYSARMPLAVTLIVAAFASTFFISTYSNKGEEYWVVANSLAPGQLITSSDLTAAHMNLGSSSENYLNISEQVVGLVAKRNMDAGEVISTSDLTTTSQAMNMSAVPLSLRFADLASEIQVGDAVDIYWVLDSRNGEGVMDPILILGGVSLIGLDDSKNALGGDVSITVAIEQTQVLRLLSATTQGRLVVVRTYV
jgi:Flp pilus assembly protein CpaB